ncbi:hypothetical protein L1987_86814 [Smallanthus sonchifolius]|uniref:Uncharacterized protein n=1 Tax=Smallanthus sonchifolius TaxID=185202 RepID=A0ACB8XZS2_9ASTR|nr:hypothetical protein L1987_86814 [Smallanthus sonchifolius]
MRIGLWGGSGQADSAALDGFYKHKGKPYTLLVVNAKTFYILILSGICSFDSTTLRYLAYLSGICSFCTLWYRIHHYDVYYHRFEMNILLIINEQG